ncbi:MAG: hypothetical protein NXY59_09980 [Aigarchaeota archaeon]|nr:hypothetical protein [Candidatus Pelearchaeum maunauluense]
MDEVQMLPDNCTESSAKVLQRNGSNITPEITKKISESIKKWKFSKGLTIGLWGEAY